MRYASVHRRFLQASMNHGLMGEDLTKKIFQSIVATADADSAGVTDLDQTIQEINAKIAEFDQKIKKLHYDQNDETYYIFVNTSQSAVNKFQSIFKEPELHYFRLVVKKVIQNQTFFITQIETLNMCSLTPHKPLSKTHGENLMQKWCKSHYFFEQNDKYYFGPKFVAEFAGYITDNFPGFVAKCCLCKELLFSENKCEQCNVGMHQICLKTYLKRHPNCPECKQPWQSTSGAA